MAEQLDFVFKLLWGLIESTGLLEFLAVFPCPHIEELKHAAIGMHTVPVVENHSHTAFCQLAGIPVFLGVVDPLCDINFWHRSLELQLV